MKRDSLPYLLVLGLCLAACGGKQPGAASPERHKASGCPQGRG